MVFRLTAIFFLVLGVALGVMVLVSSGANSLAKEILGMAVPTLAGLVFAVAWWRKADRPW